MMTVDGGVNDMVNVRMKSSIVILCFNVLFISTYCLFLGE